MTWWSRNTKKRANSSTKYMTRTTKVYCLANWKPNQWNLLTPDINSFRRQEKESTRKMYSIMTNSWTSRTKMIYSNRRKSSSRSGSHLRQLIENHLSNSRRRKRRRRFLYWRSITLRVPILNTCLSWLTNKSKNRKIKKPNRKQPKWNYQWWSAKMTNPSWIPNKCKR